MHDSLGAFVAGTMTARPGSALGPLGGASLAVKDIFDVQGHVTGCGNPAWAARRNPAEADAPAVARLLQAGAEFIGKTVTDEFAYSLSGRNPHYGAPTNVNAPGRVAGGSSSGSAAAVAGGLADLALGSDTGGSVRVPASYCGLYGLRPTHGSVDIAGAMALAPGFDTVGWFAGSAGLLRAAGEALLPEAGDDDVEPTRLVVARDLFDLASPAAQAALGPWIGRLEHHLGKAEELRLSESAEESRAWMDAFRFIQAREAKTALAEPLGILAVEDLGPEMRERLALMEEVSEARYEAACATRQAARQRLRELLAPGVLVVAPSAPDAAPRIAASAAEMADHRLRVLSLTCPAGLAGLPQASLPLASVEGLPLGLGLIAAAGADRALLAFIERFTARIDEPDLGARFGEVE